jgi:type IV pilus assembly protein PilF
MFKLDFVQKACVRRIRAMKKEWLIKAGCLFLLVGMAACTPTTTQNTELEQAIAARNLGEAYLREGRFRAALKELKKVESSYPDDYILQDDLGLSYYYLEEHDLAIQHFKKALELNGDYAPARNNLGNAYAAKKEWDKAIEQYKIVSADLLYATPQYPLSNLGYVYYEKGEYDLSQKYYLEALRAKPDFSNAMHGLGKTYLAMGRVQEAITRLEKAVELSPGVAFVYFDLAKAYSLNREYSKAYDAYNKVVQLDLGSPIADQAKKEAEKIKDMNP